MTNLEMITSGLVQGLTEFLPISSSGHLVFVHRLFGLEQPSLLFDVSLHLATLFAVLVYFAPDLLKLFRRDNRKYVLYIAIACVPAFAAGVIFGDVIKDLFTSPEVTCLMLVVTGVVLFAGHYAMRRPRRRLPLPSFRGALGIGVAQAFALIPGISRSGMTMVAAVFADVEPEEAFRFSFLLSIPVITGAVVYEVARSPSVISSINEIAGFMPGMAVAFVTGLGSLFVLRKAVVSGKLYLFGAYCLVAGGFGLILLK
jgi:undecaprenyl-diphosphatase